MHIVCDRKELENGILTAAKAVNAKTPLAILSHLLVRAENDSVRFSATDLEMVIECTSRARVIQDGACTVPARLFCDIVTRLQDGEVSLELKGPQLELTTRSSRFLVNTLSADEYPVLPEPDGPVALRLPADVFREMVRAVLFAAAPAEETRAILTGVLTEIDENKARLTTTDGRRLARVERTFAETSGGTYKSVIPARAMNELNRLLGDEGHVLEVTPMKGQVFFRFGNVVLVVRLLEEGRFPDCNAIIPKTFRRSFTTSRSLLVDAVTRALIMAQEKETPRLLKLNLEAESMSIRSNTPDLGQACEEVPIHLDGEPMLLAFNGRYLSDVVSSMVGNEIRMNLNDPLSMTMLEPIDEDKKGYLYMLMPIRVKDPIPAGAEVDTLP